MSGLANHRARVRTNAETVATPMKRRPFHTNWSSIPDELSLILALAPILIADQT